MNSERSSPSKVSQAHTEDLVAALQLIFQYLKGEERQARLRNALELVRTGELLPEGIRVVREGSQLLGAIVGLPIPGASGLVWPPQAVAHPLQVQIEDQLVQEICSWLRQRGTRLAQALLPSEEAQLAVPLMRNGFCHITHLWYLRHDLQLPAQLLLAPERLDYQSYGDSDPDLFHRTLLRTYEDTLDCPEVNGVREVGEIIEGHLAQGGGQTDHWWLACYRERPIGVLLLVEPPDWKGWDVAYVGVVPEARRRGFGRELTSKALLEARVAEAAQLTLSVDGRNRPAWDLYQKLGFEPFDRREVYLAIWR